MRSLLLATLAALLLLWPLGPALAVSAADFPEAAPAERVIDSASLLSRSASAEVSRRLESFQAERVDARLVTLSQLDYGLSLEELGRRLVERWSDPAQGRSQLLFLIDSQTNSAAVVSSAELDGRLTPTLLRSTGRTTMIQPIREGARYRQASLDGIERLLTVIQGGEDPGEPEVPAVVTAPSNVPSREDTVSSNARTWVLVLLVVGTIVPMATWWVFSR
ncbi:MAG: TPM domain-containing protein [Cyanobium sp. Prado107]|nr:TPM domain-containing protein [Cyanobium sp. Prado107]